jgi:hypothetical protein
MSGKASRDKGANFERQIAARLRELWADAKRGLGQARSASEVADVVLPGWWVECKRWRECKPLEALTQAKRASDASGTGATPVAITRDDRSVAIVTMFLDDWITLVQRASDASDTGAAPVAMPAQWLKD